MLVSFMRMLGRPFQMDFPSAQAAVCERDGPSYIPRRTRKVRRGGVMGVHAVYAACWDTAKVFMPCFEDDDLIEL